MASPSGRVYLCECERVYVWERSCSHTRLFLNALWEGSVWWWWMGTRIHAHMLPTQVATGIPRYYHPVTLAHCSTVEPPTLVCKCKNKLTTGWQKLDETKSNGFHLRVGRRLYHDTVACQCFIGTYVCCLYPCRHILWFVAYQQACSRPVGQLSKMKRVSIKAFQIAGCSFYLNSGSSTHWVFSYH